MAQMIKLGDRIQFCSSSQVLIPRIPAVKIVGHSPSGLLKNNVGGKNAPESVTIIGPSPVQYLNDIVVINDMSTNGEKILADSRWNPIYQENMIYNQNWLNKVRTDNRIASTSQLNLRCSLPHGSDHPGGEKILPIDDWVQINKSLPHRSDPPQGEKILPAGDWIQFIKSLPNGLVLPQNIYPGSDRPKAYIS